MSLNVRLPQSRKKGTTEKFPDINKSRSLEFMEEFC